MHKTRILFVDDEPNVIEGLQRMLRKQRSEWDMTFALSGTEALTKMAEMPFDVVVTDMKMPGMSGVELLQQILQACPNTTRIVLSGHSNEHYTHEAVKLAHQYLSKPADADKLKQAVSRACMMHQLVGDETIRKLVGSCNTLPSLPEIYTELTDAVQSGNADAKDIADIISRDVAMTAKLLQLVNSSFFGVGRRISSIPQTVTMLGAMRIRALVLSQHIFREFKPTRPVPGFSISGLWQHSLSVAEAARRISERENQQDDRPDQAFTAGLLHDIGILMLASQHPDGFEEVMVRSKESGRPSTEIEQELFGTTHSHIGAYLLGLWTLPPRISEAVAFHHNPSAFPYSGLCAVTAAHTADVLVSEIGPTEAELHGYPSTATLDHAYLERVGMANRISDWKECSYDVCQRHVAVES